LTKEWGINLALTLGNNVALDTFAVLGVVEEAVVNFESVVV